MPILSRQKSGGCGRKVPGLRPFHGPAGVDGVGREPAPERRPQAYKKTLPLSMRVPTSSNPVRRVPSAAAWRALDDADLATELPYPVATLQDVPGFRRLALRAALVRVLREVRAAHDAPSASDPASCARACRLFVLAPRMLLARVGQKGPEGRKALLDRVGAFQRGDWLALLQAARGSAANSHAMAGGYLCHL